MAGPRPLLQLPVYAAACTGLYAGSLALVTALQAQHNAEMATSTQPLVRAVEQAASLRLAAEEAVRSASRVLGSASDRYTSASARSAALDAAMAEVARQVANVTGISARLPAPGRLPSAPGAVAHVAAPSTHATTGASGKP